MRRLDQFLAKLGYCSRREARAWIEGGRVTVNGRLTDDPGEKCAAGAVLVDGEPLDHPEGLLLLLHKPPVVLSDNATEEPMHTLVGPVITAAARCTFTEKVWLLVPQALVTI